MARNRVIPFGYCMKNGEITTEPKEVYAVAEIFREYLNGSSLLQIAKLMESENIRYTEDSDHWNKNMVKRIIENEKHLGTDKYPQIIDEDIFNQANEKRIRKVIRLIWYAMIYRKSERLHTALNAEKSFSEKPTARDVNIGTAEIPIALNMNID